jgi:hypothetical protein
VAPVHYGYLSVRGKPLTGTDVLSRLRLSECRPAPSCSKLNAEIVNAAIAGFEEQKKRFDGQIAELRQMLNPSATDGSAPIVLPEDTSGRSRKLESLSDADRRSRKSEAESSHRGHRV